MTRFSHFAIFILQFVIFNFPAFAWAAPAAKRVPADSLYARGLRLMAERNYAGAIHAFEGALKQKKDHAAALCRLGDVYLKQDRLGKAQDAYERALEVDDRLAEAHYGLGLTELRRRDGGERAAAHLSRAAALRPGYPDAKIALGQALRGLGRTKEALTAFAEILRDAPEDQVRCLPEIALTYLASGDFGSAAEAFRVYLSKLPSAERALYQDISPVASAGEMAGLAETPAEQVTDFIERFWKRRDPTPTTPVNERLVEHYRRVYHARRRFSEGAQPWDRRGEVYIRYGEPDHRSRSDDIVVETDVRVKRVKDHLVTLAKEGLYEITPPELAPTVDLRGVPVFPTNRDDDWEYWIYADVAGGIEVVFTSEFRNGKYDYAAIPVDTATPLLWERMLPARTVDRAVQETPDHYAFDPGPALEFHYDLTTFRGEGGRTRLLVAWGIPAAQLSVSPDGVVTLERGVALFDRGWRDAGGALEDAAFRASEELQGQAGALLIDAEGLEVTPGTYQFALSVKDKVSGRTGLYRQEAPVEGYPAQGLRVSDVQVAGTIRAGTDGKFVRNGLKVIPMPSRAFRRSQAPAFYYEVYNLTPDREGRTRYRIDYALASLSKRSVVARILAGGQEARKGDLHLGERVVASFEQAGEGPTAFHHAQIEVRDSAPGRYVLTVTVTDLNSREQASKRAEFLITE
ncbi:MAG: hypothetical protein A3F84_12530 [Candidatus Handelsmanbacteria bacterium RIFCSPLOWO2_12_FULL_64_10]|uniref:Uncharacterized protein n=1 Tax=Handelsmanbacteria sp. (strain RIFCSPLOWO2_12_FULL_64_10) TaxID=1817868 RepID=A0A1F6CCA1_HANXR|nr:MAG: hypothetical protein A3F84_12530 [Candidatus Handelsmanbacteria bacterium RIFCSPLOWO2_12_FULL_64_10]